MERTVGPEPGGGSRGSTGGRDRGCEQAQCQGLGSFCTRGGLCVRGTFCENVRNNLPLVGKPSGEHRGKAKRWPELSGLCRAEALKPQEGWGQMSLAHKCGCCLKWENPVSGNSFTGTSDKTYSNHPNKGPILAHVMEKFRHNSDFKQGLI